MSESERVISTQSSQGLLAALPWAMLAALPSPDSLVPIQSLLAVHRQRRKVSAQGQGRSLSNSLFLFLNGFFYKELPRLMGFSPVSPVNDGWGSLTA